MQNDVKKADSATYTMQDLTNAVGDMNYAKAEVKKYQDLANSHKAAMESHLRDVVRAQEIVDRYEATVRRIAANLEKK